MKDELASPLTYRNAGILADIQYINRKNKHMHQIAVTAYYTQLHSVINEFYAENFRAGLRYDYMFGVFKSKIFGRDFLIYTGGGLSSFAYLSIYSISSIDGIETASTPWYLTHSAEISLLFEYKLNTFDNFSIQIYYPLLTNVSRPSYSMFTLQASDIFRVFGNTTLFSNYTNYQVKLNYFFKISKHIGLSGNYDFIFSSYSKPAKIALFMNNLKAGAFYSF